MDRTRIESSKRSPRGKDLSDAETKSGFTVAVVAAMHIVGTNLVLPAGIIYDKFGPLCTNIIGFVLSTIGYGLVYSAVLQPDYYSTRSSLFSFYFFLANHGVLYMYMASLVTSVKNFPQKHRAKVVALLDTMFGSGLMVFFSLYSEFYINGHEIDVRHQNLSGFILTLLLVTAAVYILCIFFLRIYPSAPEDDENVEMEQLNDSPSSEDLLQEEGMEDTETTARESHPRAVTMAREDKQSQWEYVKPGLWGTFLSIKFQCLMWAFVLLASTTGMFINNLTAMTKSVHQTHYNWPLTMAISVAGIVMRFVLSPLSDYLYPKVPRIVFLIGGDMLSVISYFTLIFTMDEFAGLLSACIMVGVSIASSYTFGTTILSEHFGTAHLGLHFGIIKIFDALCGFGMQTAFGEIYDGQISNATSGAKDCYGVHCGVGQMGLATLVTSLAVCAAVGFLIKQFWDRRQHV
ncbi:uncharacterized protein LOC135496849 isoform X2 [Lineus longissimus]|uniref:uncharacterized protein LOC135496849 isoform X2 n=1 Tax=Lineus longissimus TaxID=88925 RepID=UPI00315DEB39